MPTAGQIAYRNFLKTEFWKGLSDEKRRQVGCCEVCGSTKSLQAHHITYPSDWYETTLDHLQVLCRKHHKQAHGLSEPSRFRRYRDEEHDRFNRFVHWCHFLRTRIITHTRALKDSERRYIECALSFYPPTPSDAAMHAQVQMVLADEKWAIEESIREKDPAYPYRRCVVSLAVSST